MELTILFLIMAGIALVAWGCTALYLNRQNSQHTASM